MIQNPLRLADSSHRLAHSSQQGFCTTPVTTRPSQSSDNALNKKDETSIVLGIHAGYGRWGNEPACHTKPKDWRGC